MESKNPNSRSFIEECYRLFAPQKYYKLAFIILFGCLILYVIAYIGFKAFSSQLSTLIKYFVVIFEYLLVLGIVVSGAFLVFGTTIPAIMAWASFAGAKKVKPIQSRVETPILSCMDAPQKKELSIKIPKDFERLFDKWFTSHNTSLSSITGKYSLFYMMKAKMESILEWSTTDLQRLGYLLYEIKAVTTDEKGKKLNYTDWNKTFFLALGRTIVPKADASKAKKLYNSESIDFKKDFGFLVTAAKKWFPEIKPDIQFEEEK